MQNLRWLGWAIAMCGVLLASPALAAPSAQCKANGQATLAALTQGKFEQATRHFSPAMARAVTPGVLKSSWSQMIAGLGAFQKLAPLAPRDIEGVELLVADLTFAHAHWVALVGCDGENRLSTFRLSPASRLPPADTPPATPTPGVVSRAVSVPSPLGPLPGMLVEPEGAGPFPAVVLAAGSGPNDMNETIGPNAPFRDIALGLAKAGVASLRFDKRAYVYAAKMAGKAITVDDEETDDVLSALAVLARQPHVDARRLFVVGHSEGAMLAPRIAKRAGDLAGVVMLAAPARPILDVLAGQVSYLGKLRGVPADQLAGQEHAIAAERQLLAHADPGHPQQGDFLNLPQSFWLSLHDYDAMAVAKSLTLPMLILQGGNDYQVSPTLDFDAWKRALRGRANVTFHLYPGLSHLFMPGPTRSPADYAKAGHVEPAVIDTIAGWVKAQPAR